jgi:peptidyl-prolyl cis-trans isomerase B (cyclophilin B)
MRITVEGKGNVFIKLFTDRAPKATGQIIRLARQGFYDGQRFHRVITSPKPYLVQIGDPGSRSKDPDDPSVGQGGSGSRVAYEETGFTNDKGFVGLAADPQDRNSGDSQFYILLDKHPFLDGKYTVFGQVVGGGMDVVRRIAKGDRVSSVTVIGG